MDFTKNICDLVDELKLSFTLCGKGISPQQAFADNGLLPAIAKRADQLCMLCLGYGIGVSFIEDDKAMLGLKVQFDEATPNVLRILYFYEVLEEIVENSVDKSDVSLDELMYD